MAAGPRVVGTAAELWGADPSGKHAARVERLETQFLELFQRSPMLIARAPGRVNLIGEHIDYSGYAVLPMAIEPDILAAIAIYEEEDGEEPAIVLANTNPKYPQRRLPASAPIIDATKHEWSNYFAAAYRIFLQERAASLGNRKSLRILFDGTVPAGSGLSSSSAMVCCSLVVLTSAYNDPISSKEIAALAIRGERFVGVESGGMDQSISMLAEAGRAKLISFDPLSAADVSLPAGATFVIAQSLVTADKHVTAPQNYNLRVVECRLAALLLHRSFQARNLTEEASVRTLSDAQRASHVSLGAMLSYVDEILKPGRYTLDEVAHALGTEPDELKREHMSQFSVDTSRGFALHSRARHVFAEAQRVQQFKAVCDAGAADALEALGALMNQSQDDCRDLFECSCPELDELTAICRRNGALGSRLTGAGWGGCTVSLVRAADVDAFVDAVRREYYTGERAAQADTAIFATRPGNGAAVLRV